MNEIIEKEEMKIEDMIYEIRGKQVILDSDVAKLYCVETKRINEAVRRNSLKFPQRYSFILTNKESNFLVAFCDQKKETRGGKYKNPRVFTEEGIVMLATILKSNIAVETTIRIVDAFVVMRKYVSNNLIEQKLINNVVLENQEKISIIEKDVKLLQESFDKLESKRNYTGIYFNGQIFDAYSNILNIFSKAKKKLIIIDSYADNTVLDIIKRLKVKVILITKKNNLLTNQDIDKYNKQYNNLTVIYDNTYHDRYFILDKETVYHCGASINRIGYKTFSINLLGDKDIINPLLNKLKIF